MSDHPLLTLAAVLGAGVVAVVAVLPDPSQPAIVPLGDVLGCFIAATVARVRRWPRGEVRNTTLEGVHWGTAFAIAAYLLALVAGV